MTMTNTQPGGPGAVTGQVTPPAAAASGTQPGDQSPQNGTPRTYTEAEAQELAAKLVNDARAQMGREFKPIREELARVKAEATLLPEYKLRAEQNEATEIAAAKDKPDILNYIQKKYEYVKKLDELTTDKAKWEVEKSEITGWKASRNIDEAARKNGVNAEILRALVPDGDEARLETVARTLKASAVVTPPAANGSNGDKGKGLPPPASGSNSGGAQGSVRSIIERAKK